MDGWMDWCEGGLCCCVLLSTRLRVCLCVAFERKIRVVDDDGSKKNNGNGRLPPFKDSVPGLRDF